MPTRQKVVPVSPNCSSSSSDNPETIVLSSFKLKPAGTGATRNTIVENDSLSSYSWPEERSCKSDKNQQSGDIASNGVSRDKNQGHGGLGDQENSEHSFSGKDHDVIEIDEVQDDGKSQESSYVEAYMQVMYWMCVSPFNPTKNMGKNTTSWTTWALNVSQKICSASFIAMSLLQSFFLVKFYVLFNLENDSLENFVDMMFFIMMLLTKLYYVYVFVWHQKKLNQMLISRCKLRAFRMQNPQPNNADCSTMTYAMILGITSALVSASVTTWTMGVTNWTPEKTILYHSDSFASGLFLWKKENLNDTYFNELEGKYGTDLTTTNLMFGLTGLMINFCSCLHMDTLANLMLSNSKTLKLEMGDISMKIGCPKNDIENITLGEFLAENGNWALFQMIKRAVNHDNNAFDSLMKFEHVYNLNLFVFFALNLFDAEFGWVYKAHLLYRIIKASYTYRIASNAATLNDKAKDWIQRLAWKTTDKLFLERVPLLLYELEKKPIGMGRGQFLVDESFLYRFLGMVGSVFVLEADTKEPAD